MTKYDANSKAGINQNLIGNRYQKSTGETLTVESVMLWDEGGENWQAHAFFVPEDDEQLYLHDNIDNLFSPQYTLIVQMNK